MFEALRRRRDLFHRANIRAEALISRLGEEAWPIVYEMCRDQERSDQDRAFYYRVRRIIEKRLGIPPRIDTATRYLDDD